jgi:hypothetical protein
MQRNIHQRRIRRDLGRNSRQAALVGSTSPVEVLEDHSSLAPADLAMGLREGLDSSLEVACTRRRGLEQEDRFVGRARHPWERPEGNKDRHRGGLEAAVGVGPAADR